MGLFKKNSTLYKIIKSMSRDPVRKGSTKINILETFPLFEVVSWGLYPIRASLTIQSINQVFPALSNFCKVKDKNQRFANTIKGFIKPINQKTKLGELFTNYGSDKASPNNYDLVYQGILNSINKPTKIFEIGLGTNNVDIVSTMGKKGKPGASLRAFRDYVNSALIYGADFDKRILFNENRIKTFFVDQTSPKTFDDLSKKIGNNFDLMIDDGLHSPSPNLHSLNFFLSRLKVGGYAVIEDINPLTEDMWLVVSSILSNNYLSAFVKTKRACIFVVKRIA
jgi:hypothetical protein